MKKEDNSRLEAINKNIKYLEKTFCDRNFFSNLDENIELMDGGRSIEERQYLLKEMICDKFRDFFYVGSNLAGFEHEDGGYEFSAFATLFKDDVIYSCIYMEGGFYNYGHVTAGVSLLSLPYPPDYDIENDRYFPRPGTKAEDEYLKELEAKKNKKN